MFFFTGGARGGPGVEGLFGPFGGPRAFLGPQGLLGPFGPQDPIWDRFPGVEGLQARNPLCIDNGLIVVVVPKRNASSL